MGQSIAGLGLGTPSFSLLDSTPWLWSPGLLLPWPLQLSGGIFRQESQQGD